MLVRVQLILPMASPFRSMRGSIPIWRRFPRSLQVGEVHHSLQLPRILQIKKYQLVRKFTPGLNSPEYPRRTPYLYPQRRVVITGELFDVQDGLGNVGRSGHPGCAGPFKGGQALVGSLAEASAGRASEAR